MATLLVKEDRRERTINLFRSIIGYLDKETNRNKLVQYSSELHYVFQLMHKDDIELYSDKFPVFKRAVRSITEDSMGLSDRLDDAFDEGEMEVIIRDYKQDTTRNAQRVIDILEKIPAIRDTSNLRKTEKNPLSKYKYHIQDPLDSEKQIEQEKEIPPDASGKIASFLSGKEGLIESQTAQLKRDVGRGGRRKTKKNRSRRKKTHGRRV